MDENLLHVHFNGSISLKVQNTWRFWMSPSNFDSPNLLTSPEREIEVLLQCHVDTFSACISKNRSKQNQCIAGKTVNGIKTVKAQERLNCVSYLEL